MQQEHSNSAGGFLPARIGNEPITMSSREIAELVEARHDSVKRTMERLSESGLISFTPLVETSHEGSGARPVEVYQVDERDSYVVVARLSPEFTARLVDYWQHHRNQHARLPTTAEAFASAFTMLAEHERRQAEQDRKMKAISADIELIKDTAPMKAKPQNAESITEVRKRMNKKYGLPPRIIDIVLNGFAYSPRPAGMVKNSHEDAQGSSYAVYWIRDVTQVFKLFVSECTMVTATQATHRLIEGRFKLTKAA